MGIAVEDFSLNVGGLFEAVGSEGLYDLGVETLEVSPSFSVVVAHYNNLESLKFHVVSFQVQSPGQFNPHMG